MEAILLAGGKGERLAEAAEGRPKTLVSVAGRALASYALARLAEAGVERLPERGDHEATTLPELARAGRLAGYRHDGLWLTVNTPKDLRAADEYLRSAERAPLTPTPAAR